MSSREFTEWLEYDRLSPGEPERGDVQTALLCSVVANFLKARGKAFAIKDFLLDFEPVTQSSKEAMHRLKAFFKGVTARQDRKGKHK